MTDFFKDTLYFSVDIGSNTILLLSYYYDQNYDQRDDLEETNWVKANWVEANWVEDNQIRFAKLAENISKNKKISSEALARSTTILSEYRGIIHGLSAQYPEYKVKTRAVATNALRDAENQAEVVAEMEVSLGFSVEVISGEEEAIFTYSGTVSDLNHLTKPSSLSKLQTPVIVDIGGGSTEFILKNEGVLKSESYRIGAVRFRDEYIEDYPILTPTINAIQERIDKELDANPPLFLTDNFSKTNLELSLVGVAGIPTTLAAIKYNGREIDYHKIHLKTLTREDIQHYQDLFCKMTPSEIVALKLVDEKRSEIMGVSCIILGKLMDRFGFNKLTVSIKGLRYGVLNSLGASK